MGRVFIMRREPNANQSVRVSGSVKASVGRKSGVLPSALAALSTAPFLAPFLLIAPQRAAADPSPAAVAGFNSYIAQLESRLGRQHSSPAGFLASFNAAHVRGGEVDIEQITPASGSTFPGAMLHHWRGTAFVPGVRAADLERLLCDYSRYPQVYSPQVMTARVLAHDGNHFQTMLRISQKHVITVVLDTTYDIRFFPAAAEPDGQSGAHGYNISHSTRIAEIAAPGTAIEHALDSNHEHGFLCRLNTYWSWEERDGGLYMQIETVSLTRSVPTGLGWAIGPFINSIPHESLEFTLRSTASELRR
jgi:hypothetical protein